MGYANPFSQSLNAPDPMINNLADQFQAMSLPVDCRVSASNVPQLDPHSFARVQSEIGKG